MRVASVAECWTYTPLENPDLVRPRTSRDLSTVSYESAHTLCGLSPGERPRDSFPHGPEPAGNTTCRYRNPTHRPSRTTGCSAVVVPTLSGGSGARITADCPRLACSLVSAEV